MARSFLIFILFSIYPSVFLFSQVPKSGIFFQAIARDNYANPAKDRKIFVQSSILQTTANGAKILTEEFQTVTDAVGIFSISIGQGTRIGGIANNLSSINWQNGPYFLSLKISITPTAPINGWDYTKDWIDLGVTPFGTVPYALYAESVAGMDQKINSSDTTKFLAGYAKTINTISPALFNSSLIGKLNIADSVATYVTPTQLAAKTFDITPINLAIANKLNLSDSNTKYVTPSKFSSGLVGPQGIQGITGPVGATGSQGPIGLPGINGTNGSNGAIGPQGLQGEIGPQGLRGITGLTGATGPIGLTGPQGVQGIQGLTGATGATGTQGPMGLPGLNGANGAQGIQGEIGPQGIQGQMGFSGMSGTNGIDGTTNLISDLTAANGILPTSNGGTGLSLLGAPGNQLKVNSAGTGFDFFTPSTNANTGNFSFIDNIIKATSVDETNFDPVIFGNDAVKLKIDSWEPYNGDNILIGNSVLGFSSILFSTSTNTSEGSSILGWYNTNSLDPNYSTVTATSDGSHIVNSDEGSGNFYEWHFDNYGNLYFPLNGSIGSYNDNNNNITLYTEAQDNYTYAAVSYNNEQRLIVDEEGIYIQTDNLNNQYNWKFNRDGDVELPIYGTIMFSNDNGNTYLNDILPFPNNDGTNENYVLTADANGYASWQPSSGNNGFKVVEYENTITDADPFSFNTDDFIDASSGLDIRVANNINFGNNTLLNNTDGIANISIGDNSLELNITGSANTGVGFNVFANNTTGNTNNAFGAYTLYNNTEGSLNSAFGNNVLLANTIGSSNSAFGFETLASNVDGSSNSAFGIFALKFNITGYANSAFGRRALEQNIEGEENATFGAWSLSNNTTGSYNTAIGTNALNNNNTGNYNTAIGYDANVSEDYLENATAIGVGAVVKESNTIQLGADGVSNDYYPAITSVRTSGKLTTGSITYPNEDGASGQVLTTDGEGNLTWSNPVATVVTNTDGTIVLTGPTGPRGFTGPQGIQGIQGPSGTSNNVFSSITVNNAGGTPGIFLNQTNPNNATWLRVGTGGNGAEYGVSGGSNQFFDGTVLGDIALKAFSGNHLTKMFIGAAFDGKANLVLSPDRTTEVIGKLSAPELTVGTLTSTISAALDVNSTSKGFLPPRLTAIQKNAIVSPVAGLLLWCSDCGVSGALQVYNGSIWINL